MAKVMQKRVRASTLLEVLVAMVIIMVVFTLSVRVFNNVIGSGTSFTKVKVQQQLSSLADEAQQKPPLNEELIKVIDSVEYRYLISESPLPNVIRLEIRAVGNGKHLGSTSFLIKKDQQP